MCRGRKNVFYHFVAANYDFAENRTYLLSIEKSEIANWLKSIKTLYTRKFHQIVVGITEMDYAVFILVFVPLLFFIFLVLLSSFARRIQRKYAQDL